METERMIFGKAERRTTEVMYKEHLVRRIFDGYAVFSFDRRTRTYCKEEYIGDTIDECKSWIDRK